MKFFNRLNEMNQIQDDEINLIELFQTLWDGKWLISAFTLIAMLIGTGYIFDKKPKYVSQIKYTGDNMPPFYASNKVFSQFKKNFYLKSNFENWKKTYSKASFVHEDISFTADINGIVFSKNEHEMLAIISSGGGRGTISMRTNDLSTVDGIFKYSQFINNLLNENYIKRARNELKILKSRITDFSPVDSTIILNVLSIDRFILSAENKSTILAFQHPSIPKIVSHKLYLILFIFALSGTVLGVLYVLISKAIANHKKRLL